MYETDAGRYTEHEAAKKMLATLKKCIILVKRKISVIVQTKVMLFA